MMEYVIIYQKLDWSLNSGFIISNAKIPAARRNHVHRYCRIYRFDG
jgi:hypothetical protein